MTLAEFVTSKKTERFIILVIIINAITLGMETSHYLMEHHGSLLYWADKIALVIFTVEIALKIWVFRLGYFREGWYIFDFVIVAISWLPASGGMTVIRSLRVLRVLLLVSALTRLRIIVRSLIISLPSIGSIALLLGLLFYVASVMATRLFGGSFPDWFGSIPASLFTLFQLMTLESWAMGIVRPVTDIYPWAPVFFVPFVLLSAFIILNVFIAIILNAMTDAQQQFVKAVERKQREAANEDEMEKILSSLEDMGKNLEEIQEQLRHLKDGNHAEKPV